MRRLTAQVLTVSVMSALCVLLPVVSLPAAAAKPVAPVVRSSAVDFVETTPGLAGPGAVPTDAVSAVQEPGAFSLVGLAWSSDAAPDASTLVLRTRGTDGRWSEWSGLETTDAAPTRDRRTTEPLYVGPSAAVQVRVRGPRPADLEVITVDPGTSAADADPAGGARLLGGDSASAATTRPGVITRAQWGADESLRLARCPEGPSYARSLKAATVHHTAGSNDYSAAQSASIVRGIYAYHVQGNGWCDVGYNFLVDKYGQIFEGRYGGMDRPVIGAHAANYNTGTVGVSVLGNYQTAGLTGAGLDALQRIIAWKLSLHRLDPTAKVTLTNASTGEARTVHVIHGHRDVGSTSCPGSGIYSLLPTLRERVKASTGPYDPFGSLDSVTAGPDTVRVTGWGIDPATADPIQVHVYVGSAGTALLADKSRGDVGAAYPEYGSDHGFDRVLPARAGEQEVCAYAIAASGGSNTLLGCRTVTVSGTTGPPVGKLERVTPHVGGFTIEGWALDPDTADVIQVHAYVNGRGVAMLADIPRADVARDYPSYGDRHGFRRSFLAGVGTHEVCVYAINVGAGDHTLLGCPKTTVTSAPPFGSLDGVMVGPRSVRVSGWAIDPSTAAPIAVHAYAGPTGRALTANGIRNDVGSAYPDAGPEHGYSGTVPAGPGTNNVCTYGIAVGGAGPNPVLGCRTVTVPTGPPTGSLDSVVAVPGGVTIGGWALDPDTAATIQVHAYVDGRGTALVAGATRNDVAAAFPGWGEAHGFSRALSASPGQREACVYAINVDAGSHTLLGCRSVTVMSGSPLGSADSVVAVPGGVRVAGWAIDPDTAAPIQVHAYVDGTGTAMLADQVRNDVGQVYPGYGTRHGFSRNLSAGPGQHSVCLYAINSGPGATRSLGCRTVTVV